MTADLIERRNRALGAGAPLFYREPLQLVRGEGAYLFGAAGRRYVDLYNNVPCVGHAHPRIVAAMATQQATLNVHSRYLHEGIVEFAERITGLHGERLESVVFSCTGTEANEVALRMARAATGRRGFRRSPARTPAPGAVASQPAATLPKALATSRALVYARTCTGDDMTQPIRRTTRQPYNRAPLASRSANHATVDRSALVLTVAPSIRVALAATQPCAHRPTTSGATSTSPRQTGVAGSKKQMGYAYYRHHAVAGAHAGPSGAARAK